MLLKMYSLGFQVRKFKFKWCGNGYILLFLSISPRIPLAFRVILCHYSIDSTASSSSAVLSKWSWQKRTLCPLWACPCYVAYVSCESSKSPSKSEHLHLMRSSTLSKCVAWMEWRRSMCEIFLLFLMKITFLRMFFFLFIFLWILRRHQKILVSVGQDEQFVQRLSIRRLAPVYSLSVYIHLCPAWNAAFRWPVSARSP